MAIETPSALDHAESDRGIGDQEKIPVERKLNIIMTEWSYVQDIIKAKVERKFKNRNWAITLYSAIIAVSLNQDSIGISFIAIPAIIVFWYMDVTRQGLQSILLRRDEEICSILQNPTELSLIEFKSPLFGRHLREKDAYKFYKLSSIFHRTRVVFFGSMILGVLILNTVYSLI